MILEVKKFNLNLVLITNIFFAFFPISFILGNFITNLNLVLFCSLGLFHLRSKIFDENLNFYIKTILILFIIILLSTILSYAKLLYFDSYEDINFSRLIKSILFFRFFIMLLVIYLLIKYDFLNFKYFFYTSAIAALIIALDVIYQYTFGFNIIGLTSQHHNTSFFGDERISGGYIQNFSFFSILITSYIFRKKSFLKDLLTISAVSVLGLGIFLSNNRMPVILFILGLFFVFVFNKDLRKNVLIGFLIVMLFLASIISFDAKIKENYQSLYQNVKTNVAAIIKNKEEKFTEEEKSEFFNKADQRGGYRKLFFTSIETWKLHKFFGNGIKAFREDCKKIIEEQKIGMCSNHPHNYYLEILTDLGIIGFLNVLVIAFIFIVFLFKNYRSFNKNNFENLFLLGAVISLFLEVFPIKSTGSIFTTNNTTYIILLSGILLGYKTLLEKKN